MNGKISKTGLLRIERGTKEQHQQCPYQQDDVRCGDWCPLFGEPSVIEITDGKPSSTALELCRRILYFRTLIDDRKGA